MGGGSIAWLQCLLIFWLVNILQQALRQNLIMINHGFLNKEYSKMIFYFIKVSEFTFFGLNPDINNVLLLLLLFQFW